ncbi:MAG TPA: proton-conducting transporter membrane subunit [Actinophytocola sp.]|nr:proton-conducting transporter membrane subunit [Actinophytocola sp.]
MTVFMFAPLAVPLLAAIAYAALGWRTATAWAGAVSAVLVLAAAVGVAVQVVDAGEFSAAGGVLRADALTAFLLLVVGAVAVLATVATPAHLAAELEAGRATERTARWHCTAVQLLIGVLALAVLAADLGVLVAGIEAAVLATGFLVGQGASRAAAEAAWKLVVVCSAGLALALLGTVLLAYVGSDVDGMRIAVVLLVVGFGALAGLAPLHAWSPDAHGQAPAPVAALLSGALLSVAAYALLRVKALSDVALGITFGRVLLAALAVVSLLVAASLLLAQRDYQRMLAYSSTGQLGLVALGAAIGGPLALAAVLLHLLGHGLTKAVLFLGAGRIRQVTGTSRVDGVRGLAARHPMLAGTFGAGVLALLGLPPFSLFASGLGIARAGFAAGLGWLVAPVLVLVLAIAVALIAHTSRMLLGEPPDSPGAATGTVRLPGSTTAALLGGLVVCAAAGIAAEPLATLLRLAADTLVGTP